ncbi:hypothetical protein Zmor_021816 [Zophobas morio]|uniref:Uncharacterized protein n=1 Tax=Zophobas morio TaxID=2755281 RepID=A0AA38MB91_9CUCU|nr:hypothetical protein Zmor_021816 [Zophobas morio]
MFHRPCIMPPNIRKRPLSYTERRDMCSSGIILYTAQLIPCRCTVPGDDGIGIIWRTEDSPATKLSESYWEQRRI